MNTILTVNKLNKDYFTDGTHPQTILHNISLSIGQGEFVAVMGASGSGKSTLLYNISGMDRPTSGSVRLLDQELTKLSEPELAKLRLNSIGFIFQQSNLLRNLNLFDNIVLPAYRAKRESRQKINERARLLMERLGIAALANKDITQASGGQLQRVAICRALINQPAIIFGDEPTGALNSSTTEEVMDILAQISADGTTILLVTHDEKVAVKADRVLYMADGRITGDIRLDGSSNNATRRKDQLSSWLKDHGF